MERNFKENLGLLPSVEGIERIELFSDGSPLAVIENKPGQAGSLAVYCHLAKTFPSIGADAARLGLSLYAEHTADARANPGRHPNIDRLFAVVEEGLDLSARIVHR